MTCPEAGKIKSASCQVCEGNGCTPKHDVDYDGDLAKLINEAIEPYVKDAAELRKNIHKIRVTSDQSIEIVFTSCRAKGAFVKAMEEST